MTKSLPQNLAGLPVVTILHGDDDHAIGQALTSLIGLMGDPGLAEMNISRLDGLQARLDDVRSQAYTLPLLAERRMVILNNPFAGNNESLQKEFNGLLNGLPPSAAMVLVINDTFERKDWKTLPEKHWLKTWAKDHEQAVLNLTFRLPVGDQMNSWIIQYARSLSGQFEPSAAYELAGHVGNDTRLAAMEIEKLLNYVDYKRAVRPADVELLTTASNSVNIFALVDEVAQMNSRKALGLLHQLLDQQDASSLFFIIVRQFRLLIPAREILDEGGSAEEIERELKQHPFVAKKLAGQARHFTLARLIDIYHRLFEIDEAQKTGQAPLELGLDTFIASLK
jgi:DNA polymerase III subunit delta